MDGVHELQRESVVIIRKSLVVVMAGRLRRHEYVDVIKRPKDVVSPRFGITPILIVFAFGLGRVRRWEDGER